MTIRTFFENTKRASLNSSWKDASLELVCVAVEEFGNHPHIPSRVRVEVELQGRLSVEHRTRLMRAASQCPVKAMMSGSTQIEAVLVEC
jgi:uncharacterized OsmC-like protein